MIESIKKALFKKFNPEEKKWVFLTGFSESKIMQISQWVVETDRPIHEVVELVYDEHIEPILKDLQFICIDVVVEIIEIQDPNELWEMSPEEFWLIIIDQDDDITWVILPNTSWVADMKWALYQIKQKYWIHWKADIAVFRTERIVLSK